MSVIYSNDTHQVYFSDSDEGGLEYDDIRAPAIEDSFSAKDYSSRMEEIMDSDEEGETAGFKLDNSVVYAGVDAAATASNYSDRLREVLGQDESTDDEGCDENVHISKVVVDEEDHLVCRSHFRHTCIELNGKGFSHKYSYLIPKPLLKNHYQGLDRVQLPPLQKLRNRFCIPVSPVCGPDLSLHGHQTLRRYPHQPISAHLYLLSCSQIHHYIPLLIFPMTPLSHPLHIRVQHPNSIPTHRVIVNSSMPFYKVQRTKPLDGQTCI